MGSLIVVCNDVIGVYMGSCIPWFLITRKYVMYLFCLFYGDLMYGSICNYVLLGDWDCRFCVRMYSITQINLFNLCRVTSPKFKCIHACINDWLRYSNKWLVILNVGLVISESKCLYEIERSVSSYRHGELKAAIIFPGPFIHTPHVTPLVYAHCQFIRYQLIHSHAHCPTMHLGGPINRLSISHSSVA